MKWHYNNKNKNDGKYELQINVVHEYTTPVQNKIDQLIDGHNFKVKYSIGNLDL